MKRVLIISKFDPNEKARDHTRHLTGDERVSRLEDADYEGHSLTMLQKIVLNQRIEINFVPVEGQQEVV